MHCRPGLVRIYSHYMYVSPGNCFYFILSTNLPTYPILHRVKYHLLNRSRSVRHAFNTYFGIWYFGMCYCWLWYFVILGYVILGCVISGSVVFNSCSSGFIWDHPDQPHASFLLIIWDHLESCGIILNYLESSEIPVGTSLPPSFDWSHLWQS